MSDTEIIFQQSEIIERQAECIKQLAELMKDALSLLAQYQAVDAENGRLNKIIELVNKQEEG